MADLQRSIDFYETAGFVVEERYEQEGWLLWCRLRRDQAHLMLAELQVAQGRCDLARPRMEAARRLFPTAPYIRELERQCL